MNDEYVESVVNFIQTYWLHILAVLVLFGIWKFDLEVGALAIIATIYLGKLAWTLWIHYVQQDFISGIDYVLLEIVPPREVLRSPKAMELFFTNALYHFSNKGGKESYWQGAVWFWFSLEIASVDGQVHFYIRTPTRVRGLIETQMYAQYPQAQVKAVEDYTLGIDEISPSSPWMGWGCELKLQKLEVFPIKTYVDFGLDKDPKEEFKVDPISPIIEFFGSMQKGEQAWMQIVITPSKEEFKTPGTWFGTHNWVEEARIQMDKYLDAYTKFNISPVDGRVTKEVRAPSFLDNVVKGMSAKTSKLGFDTGIRVMYIAKKEAYNLNNRKNIRLIWRQFEKPDCNGFVRTNNTQVDAFNSQFFGLSQAEVMVLANRMLREYQERGFFHHSLRQQLVNDHRLKGVALTVVKQFFLPYFHSPTFVLNVEELATLWHFPGQIMKVPSLERIESKEASPPTNLPI